MAYKVDVTESDNSKSLGKAKKNDWTEISIPEILNIPWYKPDIKQIENAIVTPKITNKRLIDILSLDEKENQKGIRLKNKKLLVDGILYQKILYKSNDPIQPLVVMDFEVVFSTYIVITANTEITEDKFYVNVHVDDVFMHMTDSRNIFKNVTLFLETVNICTNS